MSERVRASSPVCELYLLWFTVGELEPYQTLISDHLLSPPAAPS